MDEKDFDELVEQYEAPLRDLIDDLLTAYHIGDEDDPEVIALSHRRRRLEQRKEELLEQKQSIESRLQHVYAEIRVLEDVAESIDDPKFDRRLKLARTIPEEKRVPENPAIQNHAEKVGLTPQQFIDKLDERYPLDRLGRPMWDEGEIQTDE